MNRRTRTKLHRRGLASMLAMLFLVLISTLAIGFYAMTNASVQVVHNEARASNALLAAESGMDFIRHHLNNVDIPYDATPSELFDELADDLSYRLNGTPNVNGGNIYASVDKMVIPASGYVSLDNSGRQFKIEISNLGQKVLVKVIGKYGVESAARGVQLEYGLAENASQIFDYGVASRGKIVTGGSAKIRGATDPKKGSILSTTTTDPVPVYISGKEVSGDISITNPSGSIFIDGGATVGGESSPTGIAKHLHKGVPAPEFPTVDTSVFANFATNTYVDGMTVLENVRIPANTNPSFTANTQIRGVLLVEAPNNIQFRGGVDITGVIVAENGSATNGTLASNILDFSGNVSSYPVSTLPLEAKWEEFRKLTGSFILAEGFHTKFTGSFGTVNGSIISSKVSMTGNAGGTIVGSVVNLNDTALTLNGSSEIIIASTGTTDYPAGVYFSSHYTPLTDTYREVPVD